MICDQECLNSCYYSANSSQNIPPLQPLTGKRKVILREHKRRRIVKWELHPVIICGTGFRSLPGEITSRVNPTR